MKKLAFMNTISRSAHRMAFKLQKHSPEILVVAGVIGAVASDGLQGHNQTERYFRRLQR